LGSAITLVFVCVKDWETTFFLFLVIKRLCRERRRKRIKESVSVFESRKVENSSWRRGGPLNLFATFLSSQKSWARWPCRTSVCVFKDKDPGNRPTARPLVGPHRRTTHTHTPLRFPGIESVKVYKTATSPEKGWGGRMGLKDLVLIARLEHKFRK
jgi:Holliday junction resolvase-like predicted endonuclease